jgi:hypothetical protein
VLHASPISSSFTLSPWYLLKSTQLLITALSPAPCHLLSLRSNILLSTLSSNPSSLKVRNQIPQSYKRKGKL